MPNVDLAAECLAAVTGIQAGLAKKPRAVGPADGKRAEALPGRIVRMVKAFLTSEAFEPQEDQEPEPFDYMKTLERLSEAELGQEQREAMVDEIQAPELGLAYLKVIDNGIGYLDSTLPHRVDKSVLGDEPVEPSQIEITKYEWTWDVARDPLVVLRDAAEGCLVSAQVVALKAMFPNLYEALVATVKEVAGTLKAKGEWEPPWRKLRMCEVLFQVSPVSPDFVAKMQATAVAARQQQPLQGANLNIDIKGMSLPADRLQQDGR